jgi:isopentenyl diphosphate isomerase/L-lactate dehydrogenase-like FMN-dependent dehydrogenase
MMEDYQDRVDNYMHNLPELYGPAGYESLRFTITIWVNGRTVNTYQFDNGHEACIRAEIMNDLLYDMYSAGTTFNAPIKEFGIRMDDQKLFKTVGKWVVNMELCGMEDFKYPKAGESP